MSGAISGKAWRFGDQVDTDVIIPAIYLVTTDAVELGRHAMEGVDPDFAKKVAAGDVIVAGQNFGCGSSREHAPLAIRGAGVAAVIAESFGRIFYRNAINIGLPILECVEAARAIQQGDTVEVDLAEGRITNVTRGETYQAIPVAPFAMEIFRAGGLVNYTKRKLAARR